MNLNKEKFIIVTNKIISQELSVTQQQLFEIEGQEAIDILFTSLKLPDPGTDYKKNSNFSYGVSQESIQLIKEGIDFTAVLVSLFTLYWNYTKSKKEKVSQLSSRFDLEKKIKDELVAQNNLPLEFIEIVNKKYLSDLEELFNEMSNND